MMQQRPVVVPQQSPRQRCSTAAVVAAVPLLFVLVLVTVPCTASAASAAAWIPSTTTTTTFRRPLSVRNNSNNDNNNNNNNDSLFVAGENDNKDATTTTTTTTAQFGQVVRPRYLEKQEENSVTSAPMAAVPSVGVSTAAAVTDNTNNNIAAKEDDDNDAVVAAGRRRRNVLAAVLAIGLAVSQYAWEFTHPVSPVQLMVELQRASASPTVIGTNGKPTVVDFWAPWCENCKVLAPTLYEIERDFANRGVNFVAVNGDLQSSWPLIEAFGVDAIPHLALVSAEGDVETALIGPVPYRVLEADLNVLLQNAQTSASSEQPKQTLPYRMLDVFANHPERRRVRFVPATATTANNLSN